VDIYFKIPTSVIALEDQVDPDRLLSSLKWFIKKNARAPVTCSAWSLPHD
jgi:hypothetical protein